jgi:phosphohistidine phosphatase
MALFLVQHGLSASKEMDPQKGLTEQGIKETERIAQVARNYDIPVGKIVHSGKNRAEQTAAIFAKALAEVSSVEVVSGIGPLDDVEVFAPTIDPADDLMVVGHLPFLQRLVAYLTTGSAETVVYRFQNSGIVCLDQEVDDTDTSAGWFIKWTLNPDIS